jgi:uncharacterized protein YjbJ (UPF0337 family)
MGLGDKARHAAEKLGGKGKEAAGETSGDDRLKAEGKGDQAKSASGTKKRSGPVPAAEARPRTRLPENGRAFNGRGQR